MAASQGDTHAHPNISLYFIFQSTGTQRQKGREAELSRESITQRDGAV